MPTPLLAIIIIVTVCRQFHILHHHRETLKDRAVLNEFYSGPVFYRAPNWPTPNIIQMLQEPAWAGIADFNGLGHSVDPLHYFSPLPHY